MEPAFARALMVIRRDIGMDVAFGGLVQPQDDSFAITLTAGGRSEALSGLVIRARQGLGGTVLAERRTATASNYLADPRITHHYDLAVSAERINSIVGVPVMVDGTVRAILYGALRTPVQLGGSVVGRMQRAATSVAFDLAVAEATARRVRILETAATMREARETPTRPEWEDVRLAHAELRQLAQTVHDHELRDRLDSIVSRLAGHPVASAPKLSEREIDVLALVATGETNAQIADRLGLEFETVKGYLRNAMRKLDAHRRTEAVSRARAAGILP